MRQAQGLWGSGSGGVLVQAARTVIAAMIVSFAAVIACFRHWGMADRPSFR
jgi:hypothetical protein